MHRDQVVAILGGTGPQGRGLARRFGSAGLPILIGSRSVERAEATAATLTQGSGPVIGTSNSDAAAGGDIVIVAVPWDAHRGLLVELSPVLRGKIVVDCVNPIGFDRSGAYPLSVAEGSAAQQAQALLPESRVVAAFHHVSAVLLDRPSVEQVDTDVMVLGDDREAADVICELAARIPGVRGIYAGGLRNACQVEALTCNLISINRRYKAHSGIRITDV